MNSGKAEKLLYSFSRWTDVPAAKWGWFFNQLVQGHFVGFDPRTAVPSKWSLKPADTYGLVFWTKDPTNLIKEAHRLRAFPLVIHLTLTGWTEVEKGAPGLAQGITLMRETVEAFGPDRVVWRFSPVPLVDDVLERFRDIAVEAVEVGLKEVFLSFLQENDFQFETRPPRVRSELMRQMAALVPDLEVKLCAEDRTVLGGPANLGHGICEPGSRFMGPGVPNPPPTEGCGCALAVDPFTVNESCTLGCQYCYAADQSLSPRKRNTTKKHPLNVVR